MWSAALGLVAGGFGPTLAQNLFGLKPDRPEVPPLPEPLSGALRVDKGRIYGPHARQRFDLILPPEETPGPYPGIALFHGGGFARGSRRHVSGIARALARQGYAVVSADYRLLPGAHLGLIVEDALTVVAHAFERAKSFEMDPARIATMGRSAGGHLALMAAYTSGLPVRTVVSEAGPTDLDPVMWDGSVRGAMMRRFSNVADVRPLSPVHVATETAPPTLLLHGCRDGNVPFAHSRIMQVRLEGLRVPVQLVALPRTGHNPLRWRWRWSFPIVCTWLKTHLGPDAVAVGEGPSVAVAPAISKADPWLGLAGQDGTRGDRTRDDNSDRDPQPR